MSRTVQVLHGSRFNEDGTRYMTPTRAGYACYHRASTGLGQWRGVLVGVAPDEELAKRYLNGEDIRLPQR